jgi:hypothetical protein
MGDIKELVESDSVLKIKMKGKNKKNNSNIFGFFLGTILTFLPLFATVYIKSQIINQGYKIAKMVKEVEELQDTRDSLSAKLSSLQNPKNLYKIAQKMGYELPSIEKIDFLTGKK